MAAQLTRSRLPLGNMADGLNVVAVGVEHEGAVVVGMVMRPKTRSPILLPAG